VAPGHQTDSKIIGGLSQFVLDNAPDEHVVVRLLDHRWDMPAGVRQTVGLGDLTRPPLRRPPVQDLALADQVIHGPHRFFDRGLCVIAVAEVQVQIIRSQPFERGVARVEDVFARKASAIHPGIVCQNTLLEITRLSRGSPRMISPITLSARPSA